MKRADVIVIGGSAAGLTAAVTARRHYPDKNVLLIRRERQVVIPCGIPYIYGTLGSPDRNLMPDTPLEKNGVELRIDAVSRIVPQSSCIEVGAETIGFERLVIATGSKPMIPPIPGADLAGVFAIHKEMDALEKLRAALEDAHQIVVIGGGFIGIEFADEINRRAGRQVTVVEVAPHCLSLAYDEEFCIRMEEHVRRRGVALRLSTRVQRILGEGGRVRRIELSDGAQLDADVVILAVGAAANVDLARAAGLDIGTRTGAITVDRALRTSAPHIFACGDCAKKISFFGGAPSALRLASIATSEARIAGANLYGIRRENIGTIGVWSTAVGDLAIGTAGLTETMAAQQGYRTVSATVEGPNRHPGGMPGAAPTATKLVFERQSGVIIGGQVAGDASAGEVINALSACIQSRMTADHMAAFQMGTHPALTASPVAYPIVNAAEMALSKMRPC